MNLKNLKDLTKEQILAEAQNLTQGDVQLLVDTLSEKDDTLRYHAFLLLQAHSRMKPSLYDYWSVLANKLDNANSYQRSLGAKLIAENVRWDKESKFRGVIEKYFGCCTDEKFITSRQAIQGLGIITAATDNYNDEIERRLVALDLRLYKETQQKLLRKDIASIMKLIKK